MPVPAIVGAAALGGLITKVIEKTVEFVFSRTFKRIAFVAVMAAGYMAAITVLMNMASSIFNDMLSGLPPLAMSVGFLLPSNTAACLTAILSTEIAVLTYTLTIKTFNLKLEAVK